MSCCHPSLAIAIPTHAHDDLLDHGRLSQRQVLPCAGSLRKALRESDLLGHELVGRRVRRYAVVVIFEKIIAMRIPTNTFGPPDGDMKDRVKRHQDDRGEAWTTIEESLYPSKHLKSMEARVVLVDCLTLWLTNHMLDRGAFSLDGGTVSKEQMTTASGQALDAVKAEIDKLSSQWNSTFVFVTNEIGSGSHAETAFGRSFVDHQGWLNQYVASKAEQVVHMVAGCPNTVRRKPSHGRGTSCDTTDDDRNEAAMLDRFMSSRALKMDSKGYFMLKLEEKRIVCSFYSCITNEKGEVCDLEGNKIKCCDGTVREPMKTWRARTAKELTMQVFEQWEDVTKLDLSLGHAAYIGREAQRAEQCLYSGQKYQQD